MLFNAVEKLLEEKNLEDISVSEICNLSTVRRGTFYRHFDDKYDFARQYFASITEQLMADIMASDESADIDDLETYAAGMHARLIAFFQEHSEMARRNLQKGVLSETIDMAVAQAAKGITERIEFKRQLEGSANTMPAEFVSYFYTAGMVHTLRWWLNGNTSITADEMVEHCTSFLMRIITEE